MRVDVAEDLKAQSLHGRGTPEHNSAGGGANSRQASRWRAQDSFSFFLGELRRNPLLTPAQEAEIGRRIEARQTALRVALAQLPFVVPTHLRLARQIKEGSVRPDTVLLIPEGHGPEQKDVERLVALVNQIRALQRDIARYTRPPKSGNPSAVVPTAHRRQIARGRAAIRKMACALPIQPAIIDRVVEDLRELRHRLEAPDGQTSVPGGNGRTPRSLQRIETRNGAARRRVLGLLAEIEEKARMLRDAKHELITANLRLVVWVARRYQGRGLSLDELVQEGTLGLMKAVDRFQYRRGLRFANYATWWIRHEMLRALSHHARTIRIPVYMLERLHLLMRFQRELGSELAREPSVEELAKRSGISTDEVRFIVESYRRPLSLETPVMEDLTIGDSLKDEQTPSPDEIVMEQDGMMHLHHALASLSPREEEIVRRRFGIGGEKAHTLEEIALRYSVTRERIRQIEASALVKLRASLHADALGAYVQN